MHFAIQYSEVRRINFREASFLISLCNVLTHYSGDNVAAKHPSEWLKIKTTWRRNGTRIFVRALAIYEKEDGIGWNIQIKDEKLETRLIDSEEFKKEYSILRDKDLVSLEE